MKKILGVYNAPGQHWVGDGFPVRSLFSYNSHGRHMSPFLLLDYAGPVSFTPTTDRRGVGEHPHRGFETVTIVYRGEVQHRDSTGAGGTIGPGDVQWMTAGAGILHEEFHSQAFARSGGTLDMVQLWVNLPAKDKMTTPGYQTLLQQDIPVVDLPEGAGSLRVIAGEFGGRTGPAHTFSPMDVWDLFLQQGRGTSLAFRAGRTAALVVLRGTVRVNGSEIVHEAQLVMLDRDAGEVVLEANSDAALLVLSGEPIDEPIVGYGPFVMNTQEEIGQAIADFKSGKFRPHAATVSADSNGPALSMHAWDQPAEVLLESGPKAGAQLVMPRLGEAIEPAHTGKVDPWWRAVEASGAPEETTLPNSMPWPID